MQEHIKRRFLAISAYSSLAVLGFGSLVWFGWTIQPKDVIQARVTEYSIRPSITDPAGVEIVTLDYCKLQKVDGTVQIRFVGKKSIVAAVRVPERQPKGCNKLDVPILLPSQLMHDTFYIEFNSIYKLNPVTTVTETSRSQTFVIR